MKNGRQFNELFYKREEKSTFFHFQIEDEWKDYTERKEVILKKKEDKISYFIDEFIKKELLYYDDENRLEIATELLSLGRFERRLLGKSFHDFIKKNIKIEHYQTSRRFGDFGDLTVGFLLHGMSITLERANQLMAIALQGYAMYSSYKTRKILIIGNNTELTQSKFIYWKDVEPILGKELDDLKHNLKQLKWFQNIVETNLKSDEYPTI